MHLPQFMFVDISRDARKYILTWSYIVVQCIKMKWQSRTCGYRPIVGRCIRGKNWNNIVLFTVKWTTNAILFNLKLVCTRRIYTISIKTENGETKSIMEQLAFTSNCTSRGLSEARNRVKMKSICLIPS